MNKKNDFAICVVQWGSLHNSSINQVFHHLCDQTVSFDFHFTQLKKDNYFRLNPVIEKKHSNSIIYHDLKLHRNQKGMWHKESLYNYTLKKILGLNQYKYIMFIDGDIMTEKINWLEEIKSKLFDNLILQPYGEIVDTVDTNYHYRTLKNESQVNLRINPGIAWAANAMTWKRINGFNATFIPQNDDLFLYEVSKIPTGCFNIASWPKKNVRKLDTEIVYDFIGGKLTHINHGPARDYFSRASFLNLYTRPFKSAYKVLRNGLIHWQNRYKYVKNLSSIDKIIEDSPRLAKKKLDQFARKGLIERPKDHFYIQTPKREAWFAGVNNAIFFKAYGELRECYPVNYGTTHKRIVDKNSYMGFKFFLSSSDKINYFKLQGITMNELRFVEVKLTFGLESKVYYLGQLIELGFVTPEIKIIKSSSQLLVLDLSLWNNQSDFELDLVFELSPKIFFDRKFTALMEHSRVN